MMNSNHNENEDIEKLRARILSQANDYTEELKNPEFRALIGVDDLFERIKNQLIQLNLWKGEV